MAFSATEQLTRHAGRDWRRFGVHIATPALSGSRRNMLFKRAEDQGTQVLATARQPNPLPSQSLIDTSLTITGDLRSDGDVQVDGQICGDIRCAQLVVGRDAAVTGDVTAEEVVVRGSVKGAIRAARVILQDTARVEGEIFHNLLTVDEGASLDGHCHRLQDPLRDAEAASLEAGQPPTEGRMRANGSGAGSADRTEPVEAQSRKGSGCAQHIS